MADAWHFLVEALSTSPRALPCTRLIVERMLVAECYLEMAAIELFSFWCSLTQKAARAVPFTSSMIASLFRNARKNVQAAFARMQIRRAIST
jgi:hypothetical protein